MKHAAPTPGAASNILVATRAPGRTVIVALAVALALVVMGFLLRGHPVDQQLSQFFNDAHTGALGAITSAVYVAIGPVPAIIITVIMTVVIGIVGSNWRAAVAFAGVVALTWIPSDLAKILVERPRPDAQLLAHPYSPAQVDASYPSGHTVFIAAFVIAALYLLGGTRWFRTALVIGIVLVAVVALSLVIDAVHFPTDVLASIVWSLAVAPAARLVWVDWILARFWPAGK